MAELHFGELNKTTREIRTLLHDFVFASADHFGVKPVDVKWVPRRHFRNQHGFVVFQDQGKTENIEKLEQFWFQNAQSKKDNGSVFGLGPVNFPTDFPDPAPSQYKIGFNLVAVKLGQKGNFRPLVPYRPSVTPEQLKEKLEKMIGEALAKLELGQVA